MKHAISLLLALAVSVMVCAGQEHTYAIQEQTTPTVDTTSVLCIGNSFTYFFDCYNMLTEIAWSQGHFIKAENSCVGGYTFGCHLAEPRTLKKIFRRGRGYDYVFLQNQSALNAFYGRNPGQYKSAAKDAGNLVKEIHVFSPDAKCIFESTWAYPSYDCGSFGTMESFDNAMLKGTKKIARSCKAGVSPINIAFNVCRERYPEINLLYKDNHHQSKEGSYLKSCVNYLVIFGGSFSEGTSCCGLDKETASKLQQAAYDAVKEFARTGK